MRRSLFPAVSEQDDSHLIRRKGGQLLLKSIYTTVKGQYKRTWHRKGCHVLLYWDYWGKRGVSTTGKKLYMYI